MGRGRVFVEFEEDAFCPRYLRRKDWHGMAWHVACRASLLASCLFGRVAGFVPHG